MMAAPHANDVALTQAQQADQDRRAIFAFWLLLSLGNDSIGIAKDDTIYVLKEDIAAEMATKLLPAFQRELVGIPLNNLDDLLSVFKTRLQETIPATVSTYGDAFAATSNLFLTTAFDSYPRGQPCRGQDILEIIGIPFVDAVAV